MANPNTLLSMILALRPKFRSRSDRVAFAVHTFLVGEGYKLEAVGDAADQASSAETIRSTADAGSLEGWNASPDVYTFLYNPDLTAQGVIKQPMLLKGLVVGDNLVFNWLSLSDSKSSPKQVELDLNKFTTASEDMSASYQNLDTLISLLRSNIRPASQYAGNRQEAATSSGNQHEASTSRQTESRQDSGYSYQDVPSAPDRLAEPSPRMIGSNDAVPPGFRPPGYGGLQEPFPGGIPGTGGMHMGPNDPLFAGRAGRGSAGRPGSLPRGARYDPIGPPGLPGFNPDDFQRGQRGLHPDLAQPGPGRGADWDSMFG